MKQTFYIIIFYFIAATGFAQNSWHPLTSSVKGICMYDIYFVNADTGFLDMSDSSLKTTDGGLSWHQIKEHPIGHIRGFNENRLIYWGHFRSTDMGVTWTQDTSILGDVFFPFDSVGFTLGVDLSDSLTLIFGKTFDSGKTWKYSHVLPVNGVIRINGAFIYGFRDGQHGFISEGIYNAQDEFGADLVYYTSDGGKSWSGGGDGPYQILFLHDSTWLSSSSNGIYKTNNDFNTGRQVSLNKIPKDIGCHPGGVMSKSDSNNISSLYFLEGDIFRSTDAGETWYQQLCNVGNRGGGCTLGAISTPTKFVGYAIGLDSQIYKTINGGGPPFTNGVKNSSTENSFSLLSNPLTSSADFQFSALQEPETFELFDLLGRQLLRKELSAGEQGLHLDMQQYPVGMYLARLGTETVRFVKE